MNKEFIPLYDLESLNETQRQDYIKSVCSHMGVPPELNLVMLTYLNESDGPRRLVAYAKRGATEIIRNNRGINITELKMDRMGGSVVWTATAQDKTGRKEMSSGAKWIDGLSGKDLDDSIMTAQTRACRRVTLQFVGAGVLDESEVNPNAPITQKETKFSAVAAAPQPSVAPANEPGKDITVNPTVLGEQQRADQAATNARLDGRVNVPVLFKGTDIPVENIVPGKREVTPEELEKFKADQAKLRQDAIDQLNAKAKLDTPAEAPKRTRKPRASKTVDLGPSEPVPSSPAPSVAPIQVTLTQATPATATVPPPVVVVPMPPATTSKPRLNIEQMKPYRQRQFKLVNELEENGFAPKEGMGNQDKLRTFAGMMFPEVTNFNELTVEQWEKYLTAIESKIKTVGSKDTIKYIEDTIGL
jgi:hypothetical protein